MGTVPATAARRAGKYPSAYRQLSETIEQLQSTLQQAQDLLRNLAPTVEATSPELTVQESVRSVLIGNTRVYLTEQQMAFFKLLLAADRPLSRDDILDQTYRTDAPPGKQIVNVVISHLRRKLKPVCGDCNPIENIRGVGFRLHPDIRSLAQGELQPVESHWKRARN